MRMAFSYKELSSVGEKSKIMGFGYLHPVHDAECFSIGGMSFKIREIASDIVKFGRLEA
jgi:hypothetical protein